MADDEVWKPIPGHKGYEVSSLGRVRSLDRIIIQKRKGKILSQAIRKNGYPATSVGRKGQNVYIHRLVALVFLGRAPPGMEVCHHDDDRTNNRPENLYYGTHQQNIDDMARRGRAWWVKGIPNPSKYRWGNAKNSEQHFGASRLGKRGDR